MPCNMGSFEVDTFDKLNLFRNVQDHKLDRDSAFQIFLNYALLKSQVLSQSRLCDQLGNVFYFFHIFAYQVIVCRSDN